MSFKKLTEKKPINIPMEEPEDWVMDFKNEYRAEMDHIKCTKPQKAYTAKMHQAGQYRMPYRKVIQRATAAAVAVICITAGIANKSHIISFAESLAASFWLSTDEGSMQMDPISPVPFNRDAFCTDPATEMLKSVEDGTEYVSYWRNFNSYKELHKLTDMELPKADRVKYTQSSVNVDFEHGYGHLTVNLVYRGTTYDANGMFTVDGFQDDSWGYGIKELEYDTYEYAAGKYAYFVDYTDTTDEIYFTEGNIMFQMFIDKTDTAREQAKKLLHAFAE